GHYLVMEYLEGEDLFHHLRRRGVLSPYEAAVLGYEILEALEAAHAAKVIHRDLKPANVFLVRSGGEVKVKILDFGLAKLLDASGDGLSTSDGMVVGTPSYMAPEQAAGRVVDARADLYSLGAILFELVTGRRPFYSQNSRELLIMQQISPPPAPSQFAPGL